MSEVLEPDALVAVDAELITDAVGEERTADDSGLERRKQFAAELDGAMENRRFDVSGIELRDTSDGGLRFTGYASTTETPYEVGDFTETVARGAFKRTLAESPDVVLLVNHEGLPLARTKSGTLSLAEDSRGLRVDADLDVARSDVQNLAHAMKRGDIDQMSFAFRVTDQEWNDDYSKRMIKSVTIHRGDVSIVTQGANPATTSTISRWADEVLEERAGKKLSAATKSELQGAVDKISAVLAESEPESPPEPPEEHIVPWRSLPDHTTAAKARLAAIRGAR